jgi:hypothetical protein
VRAWHTSNNIHKTRPSNVPCVLIQFALALMKTRNLAPANSFFVLSPAEDMDQNVEMFFGPNQRELSLAHAALLLAVEANLTDCLHL